MYRSKLCNDVETIGGKLELTVKLPTRLAATIQHLDDAVEPTGESDAPWRKTAASQ